MQDAELKWTVRDLVALELLEKARSGTKAEGFAREDEALADLVTGDQFAASMYAFDLVQKRAKRPVGAPDKALAKKVTKVGIIGAGLISAQRWRLCKYFIP